MENGRIVQQHYKTQKVIFGVVVLNTWRIRIRKVKNDGWLVDHVHILWQRNSSCNVPCGTRLLLLVLHERCFRISGGWRMKCTQCGQQLDFRSDAWPVEVKPDQWVELWICPECGYEEVLWDPYIESGVVPDVIISWLALLRNLDAQCASEAK